MNGLVGAEFGREVWNISFAAAAVVIVGGGMEIEVRLPDRRGTGAW